MKTHFFLIALMISSAISGQNWQTYIVYSGSAKNTGIVLDQQKRPHVFFYSPKTIGQHTNHSYWNGTEWIHEIFDGGAIIHNDGPSAALDSEGKIHVAYFNDDFNLAYGVYDGQWQIEIVDDDEDTGDWCTLRLDSADNPHIAYSQSPPYNTRYAKKVSGTWEIFQLPGAGAYGVNLLLDAGGNPHISDSQGGTGIRYSLFDGQNWIYETGVAPASQYNSLTFDLAGRPHVTYYLATGGNYDLFISIKENKSWPTYLVDHGLQQSKRGWDNHLITDDNGIIHVFYLAHNEEQVKHAWGQNAVWETEVVDNIGMYNSGIEVTKDGNNLYTSYYDENIQQIRIATLAGDWAAPENLVAEVIDDDIHLQFEHISKYSLVVPSFYKVYRDNVHIAQISGFVFTYTDTNVEPGTYEYYVTAVFNQQSESPPSNIVTVTSFANVAIPSFSPDPGIYEDSVSVEMFCSTPDAQVRFTLDGTDPDENSTLYTEPLLLDTTTTVKARGFLEGWIASEINSGEYVIDYTTMIPVELLTSVNHFSISPNPFSGSTTIKFSFTRSSFATLEIFDLQGYKVATLFSGMLYESERSVDWNGVDDQGRNLGSGVYICRLKTKGFEKDLKITLAR